MQELGHGGFGTVYKFTSKHGKEHALKTSKTNNVTIGLNDLREVEISLRLRHPYVNQILDYNAEYVTENSERYKLIYPLANGTLFELADEINKSNLGQDYFIRYFLQLLLGLNYIHERDIILVDIKPENILYFKDEDALRYNDFGLSIYDDIVFRDQIGGTKYYSAPELFFNTSKNKSIAHMFKSMFSKTSNVSQGKLIYRASDIWSLGMTFVYVLTDILPEKDAFIQANQKTFNNSKKYQEYFLSILEIKIKYALMRIQNNDLALMIKRMLEIDYTKRPTVKELLGLPIFEQYKTQEKLVQKLYMGYPILLLFVNTHNLTKYPEMLSALNYSFEKCKEIGEFWAWFNTVDILNYLLTVNFIKSDNKNAVISTLILSLKIYSKIYYELENTNIFIEQGINIDYDEIENLENEIFMKLSGKIYRKNIFSFLYNLDIIVDNKILAEFVLKHEFEGEMPNYAFEFLSYTGILNEKKLVKDILSKMV